jgi:PAS domain S-box-containing protein
MAKKPARPAKATTLRRRAEERFRTTKREVAAMSTTGVQQLVYELQVHQLELEMQNEELRRAQVELEAARARYADLYEFSPVGHLTLDAQGHILKANLMAATLLGLTRSKLSRQLLVKFIAGEDRGVFHHHVQEVLHGGTQPVCEVRLRDKPGIPCWVLLKSRAIPDESGCLMHWQTTLLDTSVNKQAEAVLLGLNATLEQRVRERTAALAEANERWDWVVRATQDGVWDWDLARDTAYFSPRWKEMHGFQEHDSLESTNDWRMRIHPEDRQSVLASLEAYLRGEKKVFWEEYRIQRNDGAYIWVLDRGIAIFNEQGRAVRMVGAETDITWRKEAEHILRRREHEFHTLAENVPALFSYIDRDRRYRFVNKQYEELFCRPDEELIGLSAEDLLGPDGNAQVRLHLEKALAGEVVAFECELKLAGDGLHYLAGQYVPDRDEQGQVAGVFALMTDVTALKATEALLREREAQLRDLGAKLLRTQEEERRRISRDLHDDVMQRMGGLTLDLYGLADSVPSQDAEFLQTQIKACGASAEQLTTDLQRMAHQLHPSILEFGGLEAAVREHVNDFAVRTGVSAEFVTRNVPKDVPLDQATCLYRVLQEGLQNVQKHAEATTVLVRLLRTGRGLGLCIHDDGRGIEPVEGDARRRGLGLTSMAERVGILNGAFRIRTKPGDGTEVHAWVPLEDVKRET